MIDVVNKLLLANANINSINESGYTPLLSAVQSNNLLLVKLMIEAKSNIEAQQNVAFVKICPQYSCYCNRMDVLHCLKLPY